MNSTHNISDLNPLLLSGVLVCDALMQRDGVTGANAELAASVLVRGPYLSEDK